MTTKFVTQSDGIPIIDKAPNEVLDYPVDWAADAPIGPWLSSGETISSVLVSADTGITVQSSSLSPLGNATKVIVWLAGGTIGTTYTVTVKIVTSAARTAERSFRVRVVKR